jgi:hypothetical protein
MKKPNLARIIIFAGNLNQDARSISFLPDGNLFVGGRAAAGLRRAVGK